MAYSFRGGIHPGTHADPGYKSATNTKPIEKLALPDEVILPVSMHIGAPAKPIVSVGDTVDLGQPIAEAGGFVSAPVHATVSGKVKAIEPRLHPNGSKVLSIVIENDGEDRKHESVHPYDFASMSNEERIECIRSAGIVGHGGATFPTHVKIQSGIGKCDTVIINAAECEPYITSDHRLLLERPEETIGGLKPAYFYVKSALESGRHVVTSNKELVATHGAELLAIARRRGVCFLFEASVGGGTPIITPMHQCMAANVISEIAGIVNGTTNFMLTKMARENMDFGAALKLAQSLGYAETIDHSADVDGIDAQRKISILASLAFGRHFFPQNVPTRGIRDVSVKDIALAARQGAAVRLIAWARRGDDGSVALAVEPMLIPRENQLAGVEDVFNAVLVKGDMLGDVVFYGKGAGKLPTASAVVADVIDALKNGVKIHDSLFWQESAPIEGLYGDSTPADHYVRLENATEAVAKDLFGQQIEMLDTSDGEAVFTLRGVTSGRLAELCAKARAAGVRVGNTLKWMAE